jgi:outer membrane transport energization protein TonB (TC 2.C.1.1.1)
MDIKKSDKANLDKRRGESFLLGLILAMALLFVAFEYTSRPAASSNDESMLDDMAEDMALAPAMDMKDMISAAPAPASKAVTARVAEADKPTAVDDKLAAATSKLLVGDGEAVAKGAEVAEALPQTPVDADSTVLRTVEQLPEFPGGIVQFMKWLKRNLNYPNLALSQKIQGKVVVSFIVNKDGSISSPKVEKSAHPLLDSEALRVVKMMPKWTPGMMDGKPCRTMFAIPVNFRI